MLLLNLVSESLNHALPIDLHFNMLLLNLLKLMLSIYSPSIFTFQYASIKPGCSVLTAHLPRHLHFNMLLLNQAIDVIKAILGEEFTFQYASIKPMQRIELYETKATFTFQYASIKPSMIHHLEPFLNYIYISICFY